MNDRHVFQIDGSDSEAFLQGLITNDIQKLDQGLMYAALLTPQGKLIADFFLSRMKNVILIDVATCFADTLFARLQMYKLRSDVNISKTDLRVKRGTGPCPKHAVADCRHPALGWRQFGSTTANDDDGTDWDDIRVTHLIPESGIELNEDTYILEAGFEALNGVDFKKGCYVGQEVTARMHHKTDLRKGLRRVNVRGKAPVGTSIIADGKTVGTLYSQSRGFGIAHLRFQHIASNMVASEAVVNIVENDEV
ncbi:MAG: folate-binding protein [Aestuariivita sp.]|nr:folate-binding protein [Aestuariivita sp.]MCY4201872.1 folate-binding protein [Aestuariivita sp.]